MPTQAHNTVLDRDLSKAAATQVLEVMSPLLCEVVNYATFVLVRCVNEPHANVDEDVAPLALYRQIVESTDAIQVLLSESCPVPAISLLRTSFEAFLALEFILEQDATYTDRSLAWLVGNILERLDLYDLLDPRTRKGSEFEAACRLDGLLHGLQLPSAATLDQQRAALSQLLSVQHLQPVVAKYRQAGRRPYWYSLDGGPQNLRMLALHLRREAQYLTLYSWWSALAHAKDVRPALALGPHGEPALGRLREPDRIVETAVYAQRFISEATGLVLRKFRPGENPADWYAREVQPLVDRLTLLNQRLDSTLP